VSTQYVQLVVNDPARQASARALHPVYEETRFGQTVMIFEHIAPGQLEGLGELSTPTLSDLFVALMQRATINPEIAR
jgi:ABC-2 type transport system ATP-binding protein